MAISSYRIEKEVIRCAFDDTCYGIARIVRGDNIVMKSICGIEHPIHQSELAMQDASELTMAKEFDDFFDKYHNSVKNIPII